MRVRPETVSFGKTLRISEFRKIRYRKYLEDRTNLDRIVWPCLQNRLTQQTLRLPSVHGVARMHVSRSLRAMTGLVAGMILVGIVQVPKIANGQRTGAPEPAQVLVIAPREYQQQLKLAERALEDEQYSEAIEHLSALLHPSEVQEDMAEDYFVGRSADNHLQSSLRSQARRLLGTMPPQGRELYELQFGAEARRQLRTALEASDLAALAEVSRRFFHTEAGYTATLLLGHSYLDLGRPLAAAMCLSELEEVDSARRKYDPELSLLLASAWRMGDHADKAESVLTSLAERSPNARFTIRGQEVSIFDGEPPLEWLDRVLATPENLLQRIANEWQMHRGSPARNAQVDGSLPLMRTRWRVNVASTPDDDAIIQTIISSHHEESTPSLPAGSPIIVNGVVMMRTSDNMMAVDFATGKRIWEYPWAEPLANSLEADSGSMEMPDSRRDQLEERLWRDSAYGQMTSDGKSLFLIDELSYTQLSANRFQVQFFAGGRQVPNLNQPRDYNTLVALEIKTEGKHLWRVGGINGEDEPKLAGAFFLGAPLVLDGELYVLAEIRNDISLFVLDAQTGKIRWNQQLAHVGQAGILFDPTRRLSAATPSYSDGILICPTSAGAVVAVDVSNRSLLWGYQYKRDIQSFTRNLRFNNVIGSRQRTKRGKWTDATVTLADGRVLLTPPEGDELHCLGLLTGEPMWQAKPRDESLYLACVHEGHVVMVGKRSVIAYDLKDGKQVWSLPVSSQRETTGIAAVPSGRGFLSGDQYFLPTTRELIQIDIQAGKIAEAVRTEQRLGNLLSYRDHIVSFGPDFLTAFYRGDRLKLLVENRLEKDPEDPWSIEQRGLLALDDGQRDEALRYLRQAYELYAPEDDRRESAKSLLIETLLDALEDDYAANVALAGEVNGLIDRPIQREQYLRMMGKGLLESGEPRKAFDAYMELSVHQFRSHSINSQSPSSLPLLESKSRSHLIRRDRFVRAGIRESLQLANDAERSVMEAQITDRIAQAMVNDDIDSMKRLLTTFGDHPETHSLRLELAKRQMEFEEFLLAEQMLGPLLANPSSEIGGAAWAITAEIMVRCDHPKAAADCYRHLLTRWPDQICLNGMTGKQLVADLPGESQVALEMGDTQRWPYGRVVVEPTKQNSTAFSRMNPTASQPIPMIDQAGLLHPRIQLAANFQNLIVKDSLGREQARIGGGLISQVRGRNDFAAKTLGHLLYMSSADRVTAVNILNQDKPDTQRILWPKNAAERGYSSATRRSIASGTSETKNAWGQSQPRISGRLNVSLGPVTYEGVVYQQGTRLTCVEPLSGETLWSRIDLSAYSIIWGDDQYVFAAARNTETARVFRMIDGEEIEERRIPKEGKRWKLVGRNILTWTESDTDGENQWNLQLLDPWKEEVIWERSFKAFSKGYVTDENHVGIVASNEDITTFSLIDVTNGDLLLEHDLQKAEKLPREIYVLPSEDQWLLAVGFAPKTPPKGQQILFTNSNAPLIDVHLYAFDRTSREAQWHIPAVIEGYSLPLNQPPDLPILTFLQQSRKTASRRTQLAAMCIDKRDGRIVLDEQKLNFSHHRYSFSGNDADKSVSINFYPAQRFRLVFTHEPQPPAPPAQTGSAASTADEAGLTKIMGAVLGALGKQVQEQGKIAEEGIIRVLQDPDVADPAPDPKEP